MNADCVIVDANIAFKCLHSGRGDLRERIGPGGHPKFFSPRFLFVELFKHKERLELASGLPETDLLAGLHTLLSQLEFVNEANIPVGTWVGAHQLCKGTDENDTAYVGFVPEVRVVGQAKGKAFQKIFPVEKDLAATLTQVSAFIQEQTRR